MSNKQPSRFLASLITGAICLVGAQSALAADYDIDPAHSFIQFRIQHLGYSMLLGRFNTLSGNFTFDPEKPGELAINVDVDPAGVDTNHAERDKHLRSADFLDVENFPAASFKSTGFTGSARSGVLSGDLTIHGITQSVAIELDVIAEGADPWGGYRSGAMGKLRIKRSDYGLAYDLGPTSDWMDLELFIEGTKK